MLNFLLPYSICVETTGAKLLCCYSWEAREQICGGPGAASSCWHEDAALYIADHWSVTIPTSLQSLPLIVTNPLRCSSGLFLCRGFWTLWVCILAPLASARLCCCSAATPTSQPAATLLVNGGMCWSLAEMGHLGGVGLCSSHVWSCCSPQNRPPAAQRSPHNGPPPPCMNPALTNTSWVRGGGMGYFFFLLPFSATIYCSCRVSFYMFTSVSALSGK